MHFQPDVVIRTGATGTPVLVLDTKYKIDATPGSDDIAQVVAYATYLGCSETVLLYPFKLPTLLAIQVGGVRVRTLAFELMGDLPSTGHRLLQELKLVA
jgi:5-methylcytosine-specific restriction enzyme subunit McrC